MENEQISVILENEGLNASQLAERLGVQRAMISHLQSGRNRVSLEMMKKIHHAFPHISLLWLMDQEGDYLSSEENPSNPPSPQAVGQSSGMGSLFDNERIAPSDSQTQTAVDAPNASENEKTPSLGEEYVDFSKERRVNMLVTPLEEAVRQAVSATSKPVRKITEIKVFYDDGTYETFQSASAVVK
ncbi:MAG: helix-turn-helix transcriptional regulator [Prevotella sp.]|nr:helix-turn-helix transcriptional regulator [Prevotella sp.]